jgi:hypothetical protein
MYFSAKPSRAFDVFVLRWDDVRLEAGVAFFLRWEPGAGAKEENTDDNRA